MCGICGFFGKKKNKREIVEKMKEKLVHRGPDAQGSFVNDSVALGFRRLSIIDLEGGPAAYEKQQSEPDSGV